MINPYYGEFLTHPVPLEMSYGRCGYACSYCFSKRKALDREGGEKTVTQLANLLNEKTGQETLTGLLLRCGYPVLLSNRVDPFAPGVWEYTEHILGMLSAFRKPFTIQTKGGRDDDIDKAIRLAPDGKCVWYFTIETDDDSIRRRIAPNAPPLEQRFKNIRLVIESGQAVVVGINPVDIHFSGDGYKVLIRQLADMGVWGVWGELLHVSREEAPRLSREEVNALGGRDWLDRISRYTSRNIDEERLDHLYGMLDCCRENTLQTFTFCQSEATDFFDVFYRTYERLFPINQNFINHCHETRPERNVSFSQYWDFMSSSHTLPGGIWSMESYIGVACREFLRSGKRFKDTFKKLLGFFWERCNHHSISGNEAFDDVGDLDEYEKGNECVRLRDAEGYLYVRYAKERYENGRVK
jgi:DNA repair photolyase